MKRLVSSTLIVAALALPVAALADTEGYATSVGGQTLSGVINSVDGKFGLTVRDNRGSLDRVTLHRGTIINPTGLQLEPGTTVSIIGHANGGTYDADTINAPLVAANRSTQPADRRTPAEAPVSMEVPSGTFETEGPTAEGGG
jgi:hypothetical protein